MSVAGTVAGAVALSNSPTSIAGAEAGAWALGTSPMSVAGEVAGAVAGAEAVTGVKVLLNKY